jgi:hypothetical protein
VDRGARQIKPQLQAARDTLMRRRVDCFGQHTDNRSGITVAGDAMSDGHIGVVRDMDRLLSWP